MAPRDRDHADCMRAVRLIEEHLDGRLSDTLEADLAAHLDRCDACHAELELATRIHRELSALPKFDAPPHVIAAARRRIDASIERRIAPSWLGRRHPAWTAAVAAAVTALAVTAVLVVSGRLHQSPDPSQIEVAQATADARLAFALIADATQRAEHELRDSVLRDRVLATAVRGVSRSFWLRSRIGPNSISEPTPTIHAGGST